MKVTVAAMAEESMNQQQTIGNQAKNEKKRGFSLGIYYILALLKVPPPFLMALYISIIMVKNVFHKRTQMFSMGNSRSSQVDSQY